MDILAGFLAKRKVIYPFISQEAVGRWFLYILKGKFVHKNINKKFTNSWTKIIRRKNFLTPLVRDQYFYCFKLLQIVEYQHVIFPVTIRCQDIIEDQTILYR